MFENFRTKVGVRYSRFHFRKELDHTMRFTESVSRARRALVIFPEKAIDIESTQVVLRYLNRRFSGGSMLVLIREDMLANVSSASSVKTLIYTPRDINSWFVPRGELIRKMKTSTFDVAVDLNIDLALPSAFLCKASNAPLRVSFAKKYGDQFYNFQVQTKATSGNSSAYKNFVRCLDMF